VRLVIDHYPVESIRSLSISLFRYPWSKKAIRIGSGSYSLEQIEKDILLTGFDDPRIVFAVSCAAISCPDRMPEPFVGEYLEGLRLDRISRTLTLSWILNKDRRLFGDSEQGLLGFVQPYLEPDTRDWLKTNPVTVEFFEHDWTLNDMVQAD
jgi:hypothetical protein